MVGEVRVEAMGAALEVAAEEADLSELSLQVEPSLYGPWSHCSSANKQKIIFRYFISNHEMTDNKKIKLKLSSGRFIINFARV